MGLVPDAISPSSGLYLHHGSSSSLRPRHDSFLFGCLLPAIQYSIPELSAQSSVLRPEDRRSVLHSTNTYMIL